VRASTRPAALAMVSLSRAAAEAHCAEGATILPMRTYHTDPRVDDHINSLPDWQQDICRRVRALVHAVDPDVAATIKRTNRPYFTWDGNVCALLAARDHVSVFMHDPIAPDPGGIINQGQGNLTARAIQVAGKSPSTSAH
jgi:hypothetical protein